MSCDHKLITANAYDYVAGNLPAYLQAQCDEVLKQCSHCRQTVALTHEFQQLAGDWENQPVPNWSRARQVVTPPVRQSSWQSRAAFACSLLAVLMVVFQLEISVDDGLYISFGGTQREARLQALLDQELQDFATQQNLSLESRLDDYTEFQSLSNQLQLAQWQQQNREERQDELNYLLSGWQNQRFQDSQRINQQLDILTENQINSNEYLNELMLNVSNTQGGNL